MPQQQPMPDRADIGDARTMALFKANRRSVAVSYLLWLFLGPFGGHRFYNGKSGTAVAQLLMTMFGLLLIFAYLLGIVLLIPLGIWWIVDAFLIPGWVRAQHSLLAAQLGIR